MMKREINQQKLKVRPVKKLTRNLKEKKKVIPKKNIHEIYEGDEIHDNIGGDDVSSVQ